MNKCCSNTDPAEEQAPCCAPPPDSPTTGARMEHTWIEGSVSGSYFNKFPNDPELGRILPVDYPLTYETLASYDFDPNAEYIYALEHLSGGGE